MKRWIIVAITTHGTDVLLNWSDDLNEFIDCLTGDDIGLVVPTGIGRGIFHVSDVKVYSENDDGSSDDFTVEGSWMKVFDYDAAFDDLSPRAANMQALASGGAEVASEVAPQPWEANKTGAYPTPETAGGAETPSDPAEVG